MHQAHSRDTMQLDPIQAALLNISLYHHNISILPSRVRHIPLGCM